MSRVWFSLLCLLLLLCALLGGCFPGGATETETGTAQLTGEVKWADGRPAGRLSARACACAPRISKPSARRSRSRRSRSCGIR